VLYSKNMTKKKVTAILLIFLAFLAYMAIFPAHINRGIEFLNDKAHLSLPQMEERDFQLGLDLQGGAYLLYEADLSDVPEHEVGERMQGLRNVIERRIDIFGIGETAVQVKGERLVVEIPGVHDLEEAIGKIGETPFLEFREIPEGVEQEREEREEEAEEIIGKPFREFTEEDFALLQEEEFEGLEILLSDDLFEPTGLTGGNLRNARMEVDYSTNRPMILLEFDNEGAEMLREITERNVDRPLATFLDDEMLQQATVEEVITEGRAQISGNLQQEEAREIARSLQEALPIPMNLISQQSIGPSLGERSLHLSVMAAIWGFLAICVFMVVAYRLPGLLSIFSLLFYGLIVVALFKTIPITLTLSGIAGFILSMGMAIDANILIFSRLREEIRKGNSITESLDEGFRRAWPSIRDGNFTTLIVALMLFLFATSFVQGFAVTLMLGILVSMFSAMIVTRFLLMLAADSMLGKKEELWL